MNKLQKCQKNFWKNFHEMKYQNVKWVLKIFQALKYKRSNTKFQNTLEKRVHVAQNNAAPRWKAENLHCPTVTTQKR